MIKQTSFSREWLEATRKKYRIGDIKLLERVIHAFALLEMLSASGLDFVFKGGTCLMLLFPGKPARMSVDIDIICPPGTKIETYLKDYEKYGFSQMEMQERKNPVGINVPKEHAKLQYYVNFSNGGDDTNHIVLDVLYANHHYGHLDTLPIKSDLWESEGSELTVKVPSVADMLADKLSAFAPNTTGIPYFKRKAALPADDEAFSSDTSADSQEKDKNCSVEIIKQLFDIGRLYEAVKDIASVAKIFPEICCEEMQYRDNSFDINAVYDDIRMTAMCLALKGEYQPDNYSLLSKGVQDFKSFLFDSRLYNEHKAVADAAKAAYLATAIQFSELNLLKYAGPESIPSGKWSFTLPLHERLNAIRKDKTEAFYYWIQISKLLSAHGEDSN